MEAKPGSGMDEEVENLKLTYGGEFQAAKPWQRQVEKAQAMPRRPRSSPKLPGAAQSTPMHRHHQHRQRNALLALLALLAPIPPSPPNQIQT